MLINLQHLNAVNGESEADGRQDEQSTNPRLCRYCSTEGFTSDHDGSDISNHGQYDNNVAIDAVHESPLLSDGWCELEEHK